MRLNKRELLVRDMLIYVDPHIYDGASSCNCLIGQVGQKSPKLQNNLRHPVQNNLRNPVMRYVRVAEAYGVPADEVGEIWDRVTYDTYNGSFRRSIRLAAKILRVDLAKVEAELATSRRKGGVR